ncbi:MAG: chemotaxis protein CheR [Candidatus Kapabacteria bacterium]|nr:chemotaxis protein CheR [Candidatus Kapabacteria bacterium]
MPADTDKMFKGLNWIEIGDEEFDLIRKLVYSKLGINLTDEKKSLVAGRLQKILKDLNFKNFKAYYDFVIGDSTGDSLSTLANKITTNHTFFYRENDHFSYFFDNVLPEIVKKHQNNRNFDLRIWSAGCSSGEEPYMLAILLLEYFKDDYKNWDAGILATDISEKVLAIAKTGIYNFDRLKDLPEYYLKKYFKKTGADEYELIDKVKKEVTYRHLNFMSAVFPFKKPFDVIFCRNVMIYFDNPTREVLVRKFWENLAVGGYLFIGHSESLNKSKILFEYVKPALYRKI